MALSNDLKTMFAKITNDQPEDKKESIAYGKIVKDGDTNYVQLDGSELLTPISSTTVVNDGDRVMVTIKNHTAIVTGDFTNPSANDKDVKEIGNKITQFEIVIADKVTTEQLEAEVGRIDKLISDTVEATDAKFETIDVKVAEIDTIKADNVEINKKLSAHEGEFETIRSDIADFKDVTADSIEAIEGEFNTLSSNYAKFEETYTGKIEANEGKITELETKKLDTETANATFANIDFSNIDIATMGQFFADSGIIENVVIKDGNVTGQLVGVTIKGDLIEGGTVVADKLVILGTDGLYYKLNTNGESVTSQQTEYNSLNGSIITAKSVTADKIKVTDLVAFGATIGGYHINDHALYSGSKASINNTTDGVFLGDDGQINIGNANNFLKFYKDQNGNYKLEIRTSEFIMSSGTSVETAINNVDTKVDNIQVGGRNLWLGTKDFSGTWTSLPQWTTSSETYKGFVVKQRTGSWYGLYQLLDGKAGDVYTFSGYIKKTGGDTRVYGTNATSNIKVGTKNDEWEYFYTTHIITADGKFNVRVENTTDTATTYVCGLKLEKGNKPTDWSPAPEDATNYVDNLAGDLQTQIDGKIETFSQTNDPSTTWTTTELKTYHIGDLWYNPSTKKTQRWSGTAWVNLENAEAQAAATLANSVNTKVNLLSGDATNFSQLNDQTASYWGFTSDSTADGHWYTMNTLSRDKFISNHYECNGGEVLSIDFEISTSCKANLNQTGDPNINYAGTAIGVYCYNDNGENVGIMYSARVTGSADAPVTKISNSVITIPSGARKFRIFVQTSAWGDYSGTIKIRNVRVRKLAVQSTDVEYYLSTSNTSLVDGSWSTTAPAWVDGKYMWSRTKTTLQNGTTKYSPSENGTCIAGAKGATGATGAAGTSYYVHVKYSNDNIKFTANNGDDIGSFMGVCTTTSSTAPTTFNSYQWSKTSDWAGKDKWRVDVYTRTNINNSSTVPTPADYDNETLVKSFLINDSQTTTWGYGDDFLAKVIAYVYCTEDFTFTSNYKSDDASGIYLNDSLVTTAATCTVISTSLNLKKGWNKICLLMNEQSGDEYAYFSTKLSTHEKVTFMTAYEEDMIKVGEQGVKGDKGDTGESAPVPKSVDTASGNPVIVEDAGNLPLKTLNIDSKTEQETTEGYNLYDNNYAIGLYGVTVTKETIDNGIKVTINEVTGTGSSWGFYLNLKSYIANLGFADGESILFKYKFKTSNTSSFPQYFGDYEAGKNKVYSPSTIRTYTEWTERYLLANYNASSSSGALIFYSDMIKAGDVFEIKDFMICKSSTDKPYEKYTGGKSSPNPEYPSEVKTVKGVTNLFDYEAGINGFIDDSGAVASREVQFASDYISCNSGEDWVIGVNDSFANIGIAYFDKDKNIILPRYDNANKKEITIIIPENVSYFRTWFYKHTTIPLDADILKNTYQAQIQKGKSIKYYVSFGRWLEQKTIGKNLLNAKLIERNTSYGYGVIGSVPTANTNNTRAALSVKNAILIEPNTTYSLTIPNGYGVAIAQLESDFKSLGDTGWLTTNIYQLTTKSNAMYIGFNFRKADNSEFTDDDWNNFINGDLQLEPGDKATEYEPYKESTGLLDMNKPNLFDGSNPINAFPSSIVGEKVTYTNSTASTTYKNCYNVKAGKTYTIVWDKNTVHNDSARNSSITDETGVLLQYITYVPSKGNYTFVSKYNGFLQLCLDKNSTNIKIYEGLSTDPYYEFVELPNGVTDEHQNGKLIKRVGKFVLDGTQTTNTLGAVGPNGEKRFYVQIPEIKNISNDVVGCRSDKYLGVTWSRSTTVVNSISVWSEAHYLCITTDSTTMTLDEFKQQLAENPVTVWCELETHEEYTLSYTPPTLHEGYNYITLNDDLQSNMGIEYYTHFKGAIGETGDKGEVGTGVASITEEYYLSTSKTTQTGGSWVTTAPTWSTGKYMWTRSKIVYSNPESIEYTTPICDSSWEAVNEIEIGGRNLFVKKSLTIYNVDSWVWNDYTLSCTCSKGSAGPRFSSSLFTAGEIYVLSFKFKKTSGRLVNIGGHANGFTQQVFYVDGESVSSRYVDGHPLNDTTDIHTVSVVLKYHGTDGADNNLYIQVNRVNNNIAANFDIWDIKLEKGNKPTDWTPAPEDTITELANLQTQVDGKIQTYNQTSDPSTTWTTTELKTTHTGDLWYNSSTKKTQMWSGTAWVNIENAEAQAAATLAGKKAQIFTSTPTVPYYKGDLWITALNKTGVVKTCQTARTSGSYTASDWVEGLKYTDDTAVNNLSIGGRNLIINSNFAKGLNQPARDATNKISGWMTPTSNSEISDDVKFNNHNTLYRHRTGTTAVNWTENQYYYYRPDNEKSIDTSYVLTFWVYATNIDWINSTNTIASAIRLRDENNAAVGEVSIRDIRPTKANEWQKVECKFTIEASKNCDWFYIFDSPSRDFDYYLADYKLEIGNKATDWSPAPEDMENSLTDEITEVNETIVEYETTLRNSNEEYFNEHIANYVTKDALTGEIQSVESKVSAVTKTAEDLTLSFETTTTDLSGKIDAINNKLEKHFVFNDDGLTIKAGENAMQIRVDNDLIIFSQNGQDFGSWDGIDFRTGNIYVDVSKRAQFGNYAYVPRSDGSLMLLKVK